MTICNKYLFKVEMITYRKAKIEDNQQLIDLTATSGMTGDVALRIDRQPDFFSLLKLRGESKVFVALNNEIIIGVICVSLQHVYVGGQVFPIQYVGDLKVAESYQNKGIGLNLCNEVADYLVSVDADLTFLNVSKGNNKPLSFFKNRTNIPDFENIGLFNVHQFIGKKKKSFDSNYKIESTPITDELINFLNESYCKYELGSVITKEKLEETAVFVIRENNKIRAAICLIDTMKLKQNVVMKISWKMKYLLKTLNAFNGFLGISKMPILNEPVKLINIKYLSGGNNKKWIKLLINYARNIAFEKSYSFVSIGLHEKDPLNNCFSGLLKITVNSVGMLLSLKDNKVLIKQIKNGIPFEDYSLV